MVFPTSGGSVSPQTDVPSLSDRQYRLWVGMLENKTGVRIAAHRDDFVRGQIVRRVRELGLSDVEDYFREVSQTALGQREWGVLLDRLLVKETQFFRHQPSHDFVQSRLSTYLAGHQQTGNYSICSVGCSTGEEVYSLAICALDRYRAVDKAPNFSVIGIDVSSDAIQAARRGVYGNRRLESVPRPQLDRYFTAISDDSMAVEAAVKKRVGFFVGNLFDEHCPGLANLVDVIFCQNVLIYFKTWRRKDLLNNLVEKLKPGGCIVVGPGELSDWQPEGLTRVAHLGIQAFEKAL